MIPVIIKLISLESNLNEFFTTEISTKDYIAAMYRDEIDDFSAIYQIKVNPLLFYIKLFFCITYPTPINGRLAIITIKNSFKSFFDFDPK